SLLPIHDAFGTWVGGEAGINLSSSHSPWSEIGRVTAANVLTWSAEPLGALPAEEKLPIFEYLRFKEIYEYLNLSPVWFPEYRPAESRSGIFMLVCLPWL